MPPASDTHCNQITLQDATNSRTCSLSVLPASSAMAVLPIMREAFITHPPLPQEAQKTAEISTDATAPPTQIDPRARLRVR